MRSLSRSRGEVGSNN